MSLEAHKHIKKGWTYSVYLPEHANILATDNWYASPKMEFLFQKTKYCKTAINKDAINSSDGSFLFITPLETQQNSNIPKAR